MGGGKGMRRVSEYLYTLALLACGVWALISGGGTIISGFDDTTLMGTWACFALLAIYGVLRVFGEIKLHHTKTLVFVGVTALFGGIWGIGTILVIMAGLLMVLRGFNQIQVIRELPSRRELKEARRMNLEEAEAEEIQSHSEPTKQQKPKVDESLLEGYVGLGLTTEEVKTTVDMVELNEVDLTPEELRAKVKSELRSNNLSLDTLLLLDSESGDTVNQEKDLTYTSLDFGEGLTEREEEPVVSEIYDEQEDELEQEDAKEQEDDKEQEDELEDELDFLNISLDDLLKGDDDV